MGCTSLPQYGRGNYFNGEHKIFENMYKETWQITFRFHALSAMQIKTQLERGKNLEHCHQSFHTFSKYLHKLWLMACCDQLLSFQRKELMSCWRMWCFQSSRVWLVEVLIESLDEVLTGRQLLLSVLQSFLKPGVISLYFNIFRH